MFEFVDWAGDDFTDKERQIFVVAIGYGFGEILRNEHALDWCKVIHSDRQDIALRHSSEPYRVIHPVDMVLKRFTAGERGFLHNLSAFVRDGVGNHPKKP
jgi:hypothetical protein